ncbi:hypothetical protein PENNAL_c0003G02750 [Penicillium nalgiovense]|uniref:Uncharacterized protein n=1 Tax=Penicillium nalgiovense TaxID=60175 RepID=A0A1V6Z539_PENNA|nr:hypothetical protein PENNAL_c0003G02750 [Penicillium nalgiovense]
MERRGGSSCRPAREAGRIARDRRGGHGTANGLLSMAFPATRPPLGSPPMDRNGLNFNDSMKMLPVLAREEQPVMRSVPWWLFLRLNCNHLSSRY